MANQMLQARQRGATAAQFLPSVNPFLGLLPRAMWAKAKDFFAYVVEFLPLGAGATATLPVQIQADSDFLLVEAVAVTTLADNATFVANVPTLVQINDSGSGRNLFSSPVHYNNLFGTAQLPGIVPFPKVLRASATLSTTLTGLDATARNIRIAYTGFKVFGFDWDQATASGVSGA